MCPQLARACSQCTCCPWFLELGFLVVSWWRRSLELTHTTGPLLHVGEWLPASQELTHSSTVNTRLARARPVGRKQGQSSSFTLLLLFDLSMTWTKNTFIITNKNSFSHATIDLNHRAIFRLHFFPTSKHAQNMWNLESGWKKTGRAHWNGFHLKRPLHKSSQETPLTMI